MTVPNRRIMEAAILTLAAMILIFGLYLIFKPSPEGDEFRPYKYHDWLGTRSSLPPNGTVRHSFEAREGQLIEASVSYPRYMTEIVGDPLAEILPSISVTITDPGGNVLLEQKDIQDATGILYIEKTGTHHIDVVNNQDRLFSASISVWTIEKTPPLWYNFGLLVIFMSLPVFTLAGWLFLSRRG